MGTSNLVSAPAIRRDRCAGTVPLFPAPSLGRGLNLAAMPMPSMAHSDRKPMPEKEDGRIVGTATKARQGERVPSVLTLLVVSVALALAAMAVVWFVFFKT